MGVNTKKIAVLCNYRLLPERVGGMDYFFWLFDARCKAAGIDVDWFFPNRSEHGGYPGLNIIPSGGEEVETFFDRQYADKGYSHVITHFIELCTPFFRSVKKKTGAKMIAVDHNPRPVGGYPLKKRLEKKLKGLLFSRHIDVFVGVSAYSKNQLIKDFGGQVAKKITVIPNGLDIEKFIQKTDFDSAAHFVIASHLRKDKGIQDVIMAVDQISNGIGTPFHITVYGEGPYQPELRQMISDRSLTDYFSFKGSVSNLHALYAQFDYLIHPSHGETFCYSVVEALLSNLPVITNGQGNVLGLVRHGVNGLLYEDHNIAQLGELLTNVIARRTSIANGLRKLPDVRGLSLEKMVDNHLNLLW